MKQLHTKVNGGSFPLAPALLGATFLTPRFFEVALSLDPLKPDLGLLAAVIGSLVVAISIAFRGQTTDGQVGVALNVALLANKASLLRLV